MTIALLFSGQGSQKTGMGQDLYQTQTKYRETIDHASSVLGIDLPALYFDADKTDQLNETQYTQPAIVAMSMAVYQTIQAELGDQVQVGLGLSLGEYSALAASGMLSFDAALNLIALRGQLMQSASDANPSKMVAVMNTPLDLLNTAVTAGQVAGRVAVANVNTPKQVVIGGDIAAVDAASDYLTAHDAGRQVTLNVSGAFHTPLMQSAQQPLNVALAQVQWQTGKFPVMSTTKLTPFEPATIVQTLTDQLVSTTHFADALVQIADNVDTVIEVGPGKTLMSFARKTVKGLNYYHIDSVETLSETLAALE